MGNFAVFAAGCIGEAAIKIFCDSPDKLKFVVLNSEDFWEYNERLISAIKEIGDIPYFYEDILNDVDYIRSYKLDLIILGFWGGNKRTVIKCSSAWIYEFASKLFTLWERKTSAHLVNVRRNSIWSNDTYD